MKNLFYKKMCFIDYSCVIEIRNWKSIRAFVDGNEIKDTRFEDKLDFERSLKGPIKIA